MNKGLKEIITDCVASIQGDGSLTVSDLAVADMFPPESRKFVGYKTYTAAFNDCLEELYGELYTVEYIPLSSVYKVKLREKKV